MRMRSAVLALVIVAHAGVGQAQQTGYIWAGGGMAVPTGDAGDALEAGGWGTFGAGWNLKSMKGLPLQGEVQMGSNSAKVGSGSTSYNAFFANASYTFNPERKVNASVGGGLGSLSSKPKGGSSSSDMAYQFWGGLGWNASAKWGLWGTVGYISAGDGASKMTLMPIGAGITFNLGGTP